MGSDHHYPEESPARAVRVESFQIDVHPVTNLQFRRFVEATGHVTLAEQPPDPAAYPGAKPDELVAGSLVFRMTSGPVNLGEFWRWWAWTPGADWRHPLGPDSTLEGLDDHPVVHVALLRRCRLRTVGRPASCPPKPSGSMRPGEVWRAPNSAGVRSIRRKRRRWPTPGKAVFPTRTPDSTDGPAPIRWAPTHPTAMACTTWPATCGSGPPTRTEPLPMEPHHRPAAPRRPRLTTLLLPG